MAGGVYGIDFLAPYGPGRYYLIALLFSLFGATFKVQALLWLGLRVIVASLVYLVARKQLPRGYALLPALVVVLAPGALHKSFFQVVVLLAICFYYRYRNRGSLGSLLLAGLVVGVGILFRVDAGLFGLASFAFMLIIEPSWDKAVLPFGRLSKRLGVLVLGAALPTLPLVIYFLAHGRLGLIFEAEWHRTLTVSAFSGWLDLPALALPAGGWSLGGCKSLLLGLMIRGAPWIYLALASLVILRRFKRGSHGTGLEVLALAIFGLPVLNQVRITPTFNHFLHTVPLLLVALTVLIRELTNSSLFRRIPGSWLRKTLAVFLCLAVVSLPAVYNLTLTRGVLPGSLHNRWEFSEPVTLDRACVYETPETARELKKIVDYIRATTAPGEAVFADPFLPALNFLANRPPAVPYLEPFYYFGNQSLQAEVVEALRLSRPALLVLDPALRVGGQCLEKDAPGVFNFIRTHYQRAPGRAGRFQLWLLHERQ